MIDSNVVLDCCKSWYKRAYLLRNPGVLLGKLSEERRAKMSPQHVDMMLYQLVKMLVECRDRWGGPRCTALGRFLSSGSCLTLLLLLTDRVPPKTSK